jgi:hypothetical protein
MASIVRAASPTSGFRAAAVFVPSSRLVDGHLIATVYRRCSASPAYRAPCQSSRSACTVPAQRFEIAIGPSSARSWLCPSCVAARPAVAQHESSEHATRHEAEPASVVGMTSSRRQLRTLLTSSSMRVFYAHNAGCIDQRSGPDQQVRAPIGIRRAGRWPASTVLSDRCDSRRSC